MSRYNTYANHRGFDPTPKCGVLDVGQADVELSEFEAQTLGFSLLFLWSTSMNHRGV